MLLAMESGHKAMVKFYLEGRSCGEEKSAGLCKKRTLMTTHKT